MNNLHRIKTIYALSFLAVFFFFSYLITNSLTAKLALAAGTLNPVVPVIPVGIYGSQSVYGIANPYGSIGIYGQYGQYGGAANATKIIVDKFVAIPKPNQKCDDSSMKFVDNLLSLDPHLKPDQEVCFKINIKNTSDAKMIGVKAADQIPQVLEPIEGPGNFDKKSKLINFDAGDFDSGQNKNFFIKMKVVSKNKLPADIQLFCIQNLSTAANGFASDQDTAQVCIEK